MEEKCKYVNYESIFFKTVILSMITKLIVMSKSNIRVQVDNKRLIIFKITFINFGWWTHQTYHVLRGEINNLLFYKVNLISFFHIYRNY